MATLLIEAFFAMNTIKTELYNKMEDEWLYDMMVYYIDWQVFETINDKGIFSVISKYAKPNGSTHITVVVVSSINIYIFQMLIIVISNLN